MLRSQSKSGTVLEVRLEPLHLVFQSSTCVISSASDFSDKAPLQIPLSGSLCFQGKTVVSNHHSWQLCHLRNFAKKILRGWGLLTTKILF